VKHCRQPSSRTYTSLYSPDDALIEQNITKRSQLQHLLNIKCIPGIPDGRPPNNNATSTPVDVFYILLPQQ
jgi:hypothetical protein